MRLIKADITELRKFCFDFCTERFRVQCDQLLSGPIKTKFSARIKNSFYSQFAIFSNGFECSTKSAEIEQFIEDVIKNTGKTFLFFCYETLDCFDILFSLVLIQF